MLVLFNTINFSQKGILIFARNKVTAILKLALLESHTDNYASALIGNLRKVTSSLTNICQTLAVARLTCITNSILPLLNV